MRSPAYSLQLILVALLVIPAAFAEPVILSTEAQVQKLSPHLRYLEDTSGELAIANILQNPEQFLWQRDDKDVPNFGYNTHPFWLHFSIANPSAVDVERFLAVSYSLLDNVDIYRVVGRQVREQWQLGDTKPFSERVIYDRNFVVPLTLKAGTTSHIYLRVHTTSSLQLPIALYEPGHFHKVEFQEAILQFLFYGGLAVMAIYNLFIFVSVRSLSYLFYVGYIAAVIVLYLAVQGYGFQLLWPDQPWINAKHITLLSPLSVGMGVIFAISFLQTRKYSRRSHLYLVGLCVVLVISFTFSLFLPYASMIKPTLVLSITSAISVLVVGILVWRAGNVSARYYNLAWATLLVSIVMYDMNKLGILPRNAITENGMQLGVLLEALLLSFALADRINRERREKFEAQKLALHNENLAREEHERYLQTKLKAEVDELRAKENTIRAQAESKAKSEFLAAMSHEIRTPMNGVIGMCEMLKQGQLDPQSQYYVNIIDSSGKALLTLINDILDYSKIEAGKMEIEQTDFDLAQLVKEVIAVFELMAQKKNLNLRSVIDRNTPTLLKGDPNRLRQILLNLLGNAFKFTERGSITLSVNVVATTENDICLKFDVKDTGIGISPEGQSKLFSDFAQADSSTSRVYGGTGLGLSISKKLVVLMGGEISVDSEQGVGSCFWFTVTMQPADKTFAPVNNEAGDNQYRELPNLKVLVAEDNTVNQMVISSMLKKLGVDIQLTDDGQMALDYYREHHDQVDAILMDCVMPVKDGYDTTREIREFEKQHSLPATPVFALTAHAMSEHRDKSLACGMDDHICKPVEFRQLYEKLCQAATPPQASGTNG